MRHIMAPRRRRGYFCPDHVWMCVFLWSLFFPFVFLGPADGGQYCELVLKCRRGRKAGRVRGGNATVDVPEDMFLSTTPSSLDEDLVRTLQELGRNSTDDDLTAQGLEEEEIDEELYEEEDDDEEYDVIDEYENELEEDLQESGSSKDRDSKQEKEFTDLEEEIERLASKNIVDNLDTFLNTSSSGAVDYEEETVPIANASYFDAEDMLEYMQYQTNLTGDSLELTASSKERYFNFSVGESVESTESTMEDDYLLEYYNSSNEVSHNSSASKSVKSKIGGENENSVLDGEGEEYSTQDGDYPDTNSTYSGDGGRRRGKGRKKGRKGAKGREELSSGYKHCNKTIRGLKEELLTSDGKRMTLRMPKILKADRGTPFYCWYRFEGSEQQGVQVTVNHVRAGNYDENTKDCLDGYLRISDKESCSTDPEWLPPTTLCGHYVQGSLRVKRITRTPSAFVEFRLDKARSSNSYEFDVAFIDKDTESEGEPKDELPFGHLQRQEGRIENTKCNWLIPVDGCLGYCQVVSPGYPGIYPPNTRCRYLFTNFEDSRVELKLGGKRFNGKFDMKKSVNCTEDYVEVYDGMSEIDPLIGRYCGHNGEYIISSGSSLLLIFKSGPGGPPWDYSGFDARVTDRWRDHHEGGHKIPNSMCDWLFESSDSPEGDLHTPDHILNDVTTCTYQFKGEPDERMTLHLVVDKLLPNCSEYLEILDGPMLLDTLCADRILHPRFEFHYNTTTSSAMVRYVRLRGQTSNPDPSWIYYHFLKDPSLTTTTPWIPPSTTATAVAELEFSLELGVSEARSRIEKSYEEEPQDQQDVEVVRDKHRTNQNPKIAETKSQAVAGSSSRGSHCSTPSPALLLLFVVVWCMSIQCSTTK